MELTVNLQYDQLLNFIKHLPANQIAKIKTDLNNIVIKSEKDSEKTEFQKFLLSGPVMSDSQYKEYKRNRKLFSQWRTK
jgi:hypothetical protein